jgi:DNA-binding GntR family transcriptional regulator
MARQRQGKTLSRDVHDQIRADILAGRLSPGERLRSAALCERFGVSLSVVREALTRLAEQGIVRSEPQIGFAVVPVSADDLADLTRTRGDVETLALRRAISDGDLDWETSVVAAHYQLANTPVRDPDDPAMMSETWAAAHAAFHAALVAGCRSPRLMSIRTSLYEAAELYRRWSGPAGRRERDVAREHEAIMRATLARDVDAACSRLREHIEATARILIDSGWAPVAGAPAGGEPALVAAEGRGDGEL